MTWVQLVNEWRPTAFRVGLAIAVLYAVRRGGAPERWAAAMFASALLVSWLLRSTVARWVVRIEPSLVAADLLLLSGLLALALKADRRWPMWCVSWQSLTVLGHLLKAIVPDMYLPAYQLMLSLSSWPTIILLARGTLRHQQRIKQRGLDPDWSWVGR